MVAPRLAGLGERFGSLVEPLHLLCWSWSVLVAVWLPVMTVCPIGWPGMELLWCFVVVATVEAISADSDI